MSKERTKEDVVKSIDGELYYLGDYTCFLYDRLEEKDKQIERLNKIIEIKNNRIQQLMKRTRSARIDKAIEYIKKHTYDDSIDGDGTRLMFEKANGYDLLNI